MLDAFVTGVEPTTPAEALSIHLARYPPGPMASASETLDTYSHLWPDDEDRTPQAVDGSSAGLLSTH